tara:strand:+ start:1100 stop:1822 length:723 start_codon:yes stop_codon:yes gene_type:complete
VIYGLSRYKLFEKIAMDYEKVVIGLISVFSGWVLAQFTSILKDFMRARKVKKCLQQELEELKSELERTLLIYSRMLQIYGLKGIDNGSASPISNHIFKNYYKEAVLDLNKQQRISYQLIHTLVEAANNGMDELREVTGRLQERNILEGTSSISEQDGDLWGKKVICEFNNVAAAIWHIRYHLAYPKNPDLSPLTKSHEEYLKYLGSVEKHVAEIVDKAKNISREKFDEFYNPESFANELL